ncbi:hypothetical protein DSO57_1029299 [Entomophthora muscae]|uniref:Uncharacterized protein n=1 Tax=Entomophthora muscae TaxID=34485 RepID=A0ACC2RG00_9FUNG|nr:hypothetical protein DSO57_1029299 [Entomophthora muscae]
MSETTSVPPSILTGLKDGRSSISSHTRARLDSVSRRLPRLNISRPVYIGPGYSSSSTPYRLSAKNGASLFSPSLSTSRNKRQKKTPSASSELKKQYIPASDPPLLHKSILNEHRQRKEPTATALHILDILRKAAEGNKKANNDILNPYLQDDEPPVFSSRKPEENIKFFDDVTKQLESLNKPVEKKSRKKRTREAEPIDEPELCALSIVKAKFPASS